MDHLTDLELASYLDGTLPAAQRRRVEEHVTVCDDCRRDLVASSRALRLAPAAGQPMRLPRRWLAPAGAAAAIAAVALLMVRPANRVDRSSPAAVRGDTTNPATTPAPRFAIVSPATDSRLQRSEVRFQWHAESPRASYRITVSGEDGGVRWSHDTADTTLILPDSVVLARGTYFWYVDALRADGRFATSGVHRFTVVP